MAGWGDIGQLLGKVKEAQENMQRVQEELGRRVVEASSGGGMVTAKANGKGELLELKINRGMVDMNDVEMVEDLVKAAVNAALAKSQELMRQEMARMAGGLNLPGLDQLSKMLG